jgi:4-carboxymuconolactone decarboxylase
MNTFKKTAVAMAFLLANGAVHAAQAEKISDPLKWPAQCDEVRFSDSDLSLDRLPDMDPQKASPEQLAAIKKISAGPRGCIFGPFSVLLRSPELLTRVQMLGEHVRFTSELPKRIREFAILIAGREMQSPYEWYIHEPIALRSGVTRETADALAAQRRPPHMTHDEAITYQFVTELHKTHMVQDATYDAFKARFGESGVVELTALDSYFGLLAQELNVARTAAPENVQLPFNPPWKS